MWSQIVWGTCIGLEALVLLRATKTNLLRRFPIFYLYVSLVLLVDLIAIPLSKTSPDVYFLFYWLTAFLQAVLGYGVTVEIFNISLKNYPGVARLARTLLMIVFLGVVVKVGINLLNRPDIVLPYAIANMERSLRQVQAVLLFCLLALLVYYKIPVNRNVKGLLFGYSLFIGADVISFTFITHPNSGFAILMRQINPVCYATSLVIWLVALWSPSLQRVLEGREELVQDYEILARETRILLLRARTHLIRVSRP